MENMVDSFLQIRELRFQTDNQPFCDLPQKHSRFAGRIYKDAVFDTNRKSLLRRISAEKGLK